MGNLFLSTLFIFGTIGLFVLWGLTHAYPIYGVV